MMKSIILTVSLLASAFASAKTATIYDVLRATTEAVVTEQEARGINWTVGDTAAYTLSVSFIKGSMVYTVKALNGNEGVLLQDVDMGFAGKQSCETTLDLSTGEVKKMVCNGQEQQPGAAGEYEVLETKEDNITVPAGAFNCLYMKIHDKKNNQDIEQWANPKQVPIMGMVKAIMPSQLGPLTLELKSYKKN
jgi:hypothetical protein